ncbi:MAG: M56 family metallopeptidase, partial [Nannocystaceae bacterium]|nr:M56 family metallopeptidase [Nannocystaceae bacterium]
ILVDGMEFLDSALVAWHVRATVGLAAVALANLALRNCRERTRHRVLAWGMLAAVLLPTLAAIAPNAWGLPVGTRAPLETSTTATLTTALPDLAPVAGQVAATTTPALPTFDVGAGALLVWSIGAGLFLVGVGVAAIGSFSLRRSASAVSLPTRALLDQLQMQAGTSARLGISDGVHGPVVVGAMAPTILLPREANAWSEARLQAVLAHELGHVAHADHRWFPLAYVVRGMLWFNPLAWLVARAFFRAAEFSADQAAVSGTMRAPSYATQLLSLANSGVSTAAPMLAAAALGRPDVATRIRRLLSSRPAVAQLRRVIPVTLGLLGAWACIVLVRPATVISENANNVQSSEASNLLPIPDRAHRISIHGGEIAATASNGRRWSQKTGTTPVRHGHLLLELRDFLAAQGDDGRPLVVDADRSLDFPALIDVLYTAGKAGVSTYYLEVLTEAGPRVLSISPPMFYAKPPSPFSNPGQPAPPGLRVEVLVGEDSLRLGTRPSLTEPPTYDDPQLSCRARTQDPAALRETAQNLCDAVEGAAIEMTYTGLPSTTYGTLTDAMVATALPCAGTQLIKSGPRPGPKDPPNCSETLEGFRVKATR